MSDEYGRHKENDLSDVSSKHNAGVCTVIVTVILCSVIPRASPFEAIGLDPILAIRQGPWDSRDGHQAMC